MEWTMMGFVITLAVLCIMEEANNEARKGCKSMIISFAAMGTALASFAEGAILAASVYLVSRGVRNPLRNRKK